MAIIALASLLQVIFNPNSGQILELMNDGRSWGSKVHDIDGKHEAIWLKLSLFVSI